MAINNNTPYAEKLKDPRWQKRRLAILQRDGWACQRCYDTESTLVVHHRYYLPNTEPWDYPDTLLLTLCDECHEREKAELPRLIEFIINKLKETFLSRELFEIAKGLVVFHLTNAPELVAPAIAWFLSTPNIQQEIVNRYWEEERKKSRAEKLLNG